MAVRVPYRQLVTHTAYQYEIIIFNALPVLTRREIQNIFAKEFSSVMLPTRRTTQA
jgi:hypothetical protein